MNLMLDLNVSKGYKEVFPPIIVNRESMIGTGQLPKFAHDLFTISDPEFYLIPTAEVPVTNIHRDEILKKTSQLITQHIHPVSGVRQAHMEKM